MRKIVLLLFILGCVPSAQVDDPLSLITFPEGFSISYYADDVPGARSMTLSEGGVLYVGTRKTGKVYAIVDTDDDFVADDVFVVDSGLLSPNGVAFRNGSLYVAEINRILRYDEIENRLDDPPEPVVVFDDLPSETHHGWKFIRFGPDGKLYIPVGAPCNICNPEKPFASIARINPDGSDFDIFASGIRNSVGFDWDPATNELWFTDNGRDWWGDDIPPDELNHAPREGMHFGYPFCHGDGLVDDEFGKRTCTGYTGTAQDLGPHVAALGMRFYTGNMFPKAYTNQIFIAEHGSWNRKDPIGYRVSLVTLEDNKPVSYEVFAEGWLQYGNSWGRPVDVEIMRDGSMLVSDDKADVIYRISYTS